MTYIFKGSADLRLVLGSPVALLLTGCLLIDPPSELESTVNGSGAVGTTNGNEGGEGGEGSAPIVNGNGGATGGTSGSDAGGSGGSGGTAGSGGMGGPDFTPLGEPCAASAECDNGLHCDGQEACNTDGVCEAGEQPCADTVPCTDDTCDESADACAFVPNHTLCTDAAAPTCDMEEGCILLPCTGNAECDDGLYCNGAETCINGTCAGGRAPLLDDGIPCTFDACTEGQRVVHLPNDVTLTVEVSENGIVSSDPSGIYCSDNTCPFVFECGEEITLKYSVPHDAAWWGLQSWGSELCEGVHDCTFQIRDNVTIAPQFARPNYVFMSSVRYPANLGGVSGAKDKCNDLADAAGLDGEFIPWLSTGTDFPSLHLAGAQGWIHTDGRVFANHLYTSESYYPTFNDESGNPIAAGETAWSGTDNRGQPHVWSVGNEDSFFCDGWSSNVGGGVVGESGVANWSWGGGSADCSGQRRLFCVGVSATTSVQPMRSVGRRAFLHEGWTPGGGIASADQACNDDAQAAGLSGTFRAALATSTASAMSRFDLTADPWVRLDEVPLGATAGEFFTNPKIGLVLTTDGSYAGYWVYTGIDGAPSQPGTLTCNDWTDNTGATQTWAGRAPDPAASFRDSQIACEGAEAIYCLEE